MKKIIYLIITLLIFIEPIYAFELKSDKVIMVNLNEDKVLYEKNADEKSQIASLTKIITAITIIENTDDINKEITITNSMLTGLDGYAKLGLKVNDKLTILELLYATMLPSAADAAQALAISTSGSIDEFAKLMNEEAKKIGATESNFSNPVGMDDEYNYSTSRDLYKILKYSLQNETFKILFESDKYYIESIDKMITKTLVTTVAQNKIDASIIKGAKTGFTYDAGLCLASTASINGVDYLVINLNGPEGTLNYIKDPIELYNYFSTNYEYKNIMDEGQILKILEVKKSKIKEINFKAKETKKMYLKKDFNISDLNMIYEGREFITKEVKLGDIVGVVKFIYNDEIIYTYDLYLEEEIKYYNYVPLIITLIFSFILFVIIICLVIKIKRRKRRKRK